MIPVYSASGLWIPLHRYSLRYGQSVKYCRPSSRAKAQLYYWFWLELAAARDTLPAGPSPTPSPPQECCLSWIP